MQGIARRGFAARRSAPAAPGPEASPAFGARQVACRTAIQERLQRSFWDTSRFSGTPAFREAQPAQHAALRELLSLILCGWRAGSHNMQPKAEKGENTAARTRGVCAEDFNFDTT